MAIFTPPLTVFWTEHYVIAHAPAYPQSEHITTASVALKNCSGTPEAPSIRSQTAGRTHREWSPGTEFPAVPTCTASYSIRVSGPLGLPITSVDLLRPPHRPRG